MELVVRNASIADAVAIVAFWGAAAENSSRPVDTTAAVEIQVARDPEALILAIDGDQIAGTIIAGWDGWRGHLYRLAVAPSHRRKGVGRLLIDAAETHLRALGAARIDAMVLDDNEPAHGVWAACGYTLQSEWSRWIKPLSSAIHFGSEDSRRAS